MRRQAATSKGLDRRLNDLQLQRVSDPRVLAKVRHRLPIMLRALVTAMVTMARSLRAVEQRTAQMAHRHSRGGPTGRIADNTFSRLLGRLPQHELMACLHRLVKAERRRGNLKPDRLPFGAVAVDGKHVATLRWHDLCRVLGLETDQAQVTKVRRELAVHFPQAQLCESGAGEPYALVRVHTVTLISAAVGLCVHQRPIAGHTNEIGAMPELLDELGAAYGRTKLYQVVTTDAGNTSLAVATKLVAQGLDYYCQFKAEHGDLNAEAERVLGQRRPSRAAATVTETQNGDVVTYHLWRYDLGETGWLDWDHARQIVRVRRVTENKRTGKKTFGNRYWVTSRGVDRLSPRQALALSRAHWRCEDETHWTFDAELGEDRRRLSWSRHPQGVLTVSAIRAMALAILAVARQLSRFSHTEETPPWHQVAEHFLLQLCVSVLETKAFDDV